MKFTETKLKGSFIIEPTKLNDDRGFFTRVWDKKIFHEMGLNSKLEQCNVSLSKKKGTIRGMHYQIEPYQETKLVRCTRGKIYDVIIDLRPNSKTFKEWIGVELTFLNHKILYVPKGFAHGFQSLEDNTEIFYQVSQSYTPNAEKGINWKDDAFNISWPLEPTVISQKDSSWPKFNF
jgi:dTDP-4-dehydrorhamnose 3,5-epimerase